MPVVPTYESRVNLNPTPVGETRFVDTTKMFPSTAPDFTKISAAAMKFQERIDKSRALEAKNAMEQFVFDSTYGDNGYLKQHGKNYLDPDENGRGPIQRGDEAFRKFRDDYLKKGNFTSSQLELINKDSEAIRMQFQAGMGAHMLREQTVYDNQNIKANVENNARMGAVHYNNLTLLEGDLKKVKEAMDFDDQVNGNTAAVSEAKRRAAYSQVVGSAMAAAFSEVPNDPENAYKAANAIYKKYKGTDYMTAEAKLKYKALLDEAGVKAQSVGINRGLDSVIANQNNTTAKAVTMIAANKVPKDLFMSALQKGNPIQKDGKTAGGGYGFSGITESAAKETVQAHSATMVWDASRFKGDEGYRLEIGAQRAEDLLNKSETIEEAVARFHYGNKKVEDAFSASEKKGGTWLDHFGERDHVEKIAGRVKDEMYKQTLFDRGGKKLDALSVEFFNKNRSYMSDEELSNYVFNRAPQYAKGSENHEKLFKSAKIEMMRLKASAEKEFTNRVVTCTRAIEKGEDLPLNVLQELPPATQVALRDFSNKYKMGFFEANTEMVEYFKQHPTEMHLEDNEKYEALRIHFGEEAKTMDTIRAAAKYQYFSALGRMQEAKQAATEGKLDPAFMPTEDKVKNAVTWYFNAPFDIKNAEHRGIFFRIQSLAWAEAQNRAMFTNEKDGSKGKAVNGDDLLMNVVSRMKTTLMSGEAILPLGMKRSDMPSRSDTDFKQTLLRLTQMYVKSAHNIEEDVKSIKPTEEQQDKVFGLLMAGQSFPFSVPDNFGSPAFLSEFAISQPVWNQAKKEVGTANPFLTLGRYMQLLSKPEGSAPEPTQSVSPTNNEHWDW